MTFPQRMHRAVGFSLDRTGLWMDKRNGSTTLKPWRWLLPRLALFGAGWGLGWWIGS
jgi:hypothetical protein